MEQDDDLAPRQANEALICLLEMRPRKGKYVRAQATGERRTQGPDASLGAISGRKAGSTPS